MKHSSFIFYLFLIIALVSCKEKAAPDLKEDEVYEILNEIILCDSLEIDKVCSSFNSFDLHGPGFGDEFSNRDKQFIIRQKKLLGTLSIKPNKLKWYSPQDKKTKYSHVDSLCFNGIIYLLSFPLISANRQKVVIKITRDCNCSFGSEGGVYLYEKRNGKWIKSNSFDTWQS